MTLTRSSQGIYRDGAECVMWFQPWGKPVGWYWGQYWAFWTAIGPYKTLKAAVAAMRRNRRSLAARGKRGGKGEGR